MNIQMWINSRESNVRNNEGRDDAVPKVTKTAGTMTEMASSSLAADRTKKPGVYRCSSSRCDCCTYLKADIHQFQTTDKKKSYNIREVLTCDSKSVVYVIECQKCRSRFVRKTASTMKRRFSKEKNSILKKQHRPVSHHFNSAGHSLKDLKLFPIEQVTDSKKLKEREDHWIEELVLLDTGPDLLQCFYGMEELGDAPDEPEEPSRPSMGESSTGLTPKRKNEDAGGPSPKKRRKKKKRAVFSRETEDILSKYEDAIEECRETISEISPKVERISCTKNESKKFLETLRNNISLLAEQKLTDKIYIGVFGRTGVGKSSLINAIVNERHILPSGGSQACTSVIVNVQANTKSEKYRADIEFISREDWNEELQFLLEILSSNLDNRPDEGAAYDEDADEMQEMAKEKIKAVYGEDGLHKDYNELVADKKISEILKNCTLTFDTAEELSQHIGSYIRSDSDGGLQYWPLVKCVTISLPRSPALLDRIVLVDLPGTGDANKQRDEMWKECLSRCASVWIVSDINRALSDKEAQKIFDESLRTIAGAGECHNITFVCTKTDDIDPKEIRKNDKITDEQLEISEFKGSLDYKKKEKQACILHRNEKVKENFLKKHKVKAERHLLGENTDSDRFFNVFTVSSRQYRLIQEEEEEERILDLDETDLPILIEHMKKLYVLHSEKAVKDYVSELSLIISFLHLSKNPCNTKIESFTSNEFRKLENELKNECEKINKFLTDTENKLRDCLAKGVKEAEKMCLVNARKVLEPRKRCYSSYHRTLKALCKASGYFRCGNGDIIDLNYTLAEPMYTSMKNSNIFLQTFRPGSSRRSIYGRFETFKELFIPPWNLEANKKQPEKYLRLVCIKTKQRKLLSNMEKEILQRKKSIYNSLSSSVQATMMPAYTDFSGAEKYTMTDIQNRLREKVQSSKNTIFQQAMKEMLRQFEDLKCWAVNELETRLRAAMRVALHQIPDDLINLPDVDEEFQNMKSWCDFLDLEIFV